VIVSLNVGGEKKDRVSKEENRMGRKRRAAKVVDTIWQVPDALWEGMIEPVLAEKYPPARTGRPRVDLRQVFNGIIHQLRTGCQWNQLPSEFGSDSSVHRWFSRFCADGIFETIWSALVEVCDELGGVDWQWQAADGALGKARFGGTRPAKTRPIAANRAPSGVC
jgi:putative transposase